MKSRQSVRRRGQPLLALALLMVSWVGARATLWEPPVIKPEGRIETLVKEAARKSAVKPGAAPASKRQRKEPAGPTPLQPRSGLVPLQHETMEHGLTPPVLEPTPPALEPNQQLESTPPVASTQASSGQTASFSSALAIEAAHQELMVEGREVAVIEQGEALAAPERRLPGQNALIQTAGSRWAADAWLLLREGGNGYNAPGAGLPGVVVPVGFYGGSQVGMVLRYRLSPGSVWRPTLYLRGSSGLQYPRGEELAGGFAFRPLGSLPLSVMVEGRAIHTPTGTRVRPAVAVVSELPPARLPLGLRGEAYVQAGYVGGRDATAFVDGQARVEKPFIKTGKFELRAGGGAWGGAQRGASRLDLGPTATLAVPVGPGGARVSADYRIRVAGRAAPGSGAVITLSAGF